jgi:hypothetical protein
MGTLEKELERLKSQQSKYEQKVHNYIQDDMHRNSVQCAKDSLKNIKDMIKTCTQLIKIRNQFKEKNPI